MDFLSTINKVLMDHGYDSEFIPSFSNNDSVNEKYFFHHIKKCGGMSIFSAIRQSVDYAEKIYKHPVMLTKRLDKDVYWEQFFEYSKSNDARSLFISSHISGDHYYSLGRDVKRVAVFREPYSRAKSEYQYHWAMFSLVVDYGLN